MNETPQAQAQILPLTEKQLTIVREEIGRSRKQRTDTIAQWGVLDNLERYTAKNVRVNTTAQGAIDGRINVGKDFSDVERKKAALFYDTPEIALVPDPGTDPVALPLHQELLNALLSSKQMDAKATVLPTILDCLVAIQPVPTEIGYTAVTVEVEATQQVPVVDPMTGQPAIDPATQQPQMQSQPVVDPMTGQPQMVPMTVWEEFFWTPISPRATLVPVSLKNTRYDRATWIGYDFLRPTSQVRREYQLDEEWTGGDLTGDNKPYFETLADQNSNGEPMAGGTKLWYRAYWLDPTVTHPELIRELVLLEGSDTPVVHRNCPYQEFDQQGRLTPDSMQGFPQHPLALRDLTDSPYVAADCTVTGPLTRELNKSRTLNIEQRNGSKMHLLYDPSKLNQEARDKVTENDLPMLIPVEPGVLDSGNSSTIFQQIPALQQSRDSFTTQQIIEHDRAEILGIGSNQLGVASRGSKTATEVQNVQRNTEARFEQERQRVLEWYVKGVQKLSALVLRYGDRKAIEILGPQRGQMWVKARDAGAFGPFSFETVIDSGNYIDIEARKRQDMQLYNMTAKDPSLNRAIVQARLATDFGLDPSGWIQSKPPEEKPEPPTISIAVSPQDLDPSLPSYVGTYAILTAGGVKGLPPPQPVAIQPPAPQAPVQGHGGMSELTPRLNQHQLSETGENSGPRVN